MKRPFQDKRPLGPFAQIRADKEKKGRGRSTSGADQTRAPETIPKSSNSSKAKLGIEYTFSTGVQGDDEREEVRQSMLFHSSSFLGDIEDVGLNRVGDVGRVILASESANSVDIESAKKAITAELQDQRLRVKAEDAEAIIVR